MLRVGLTGGLGSGKSTVGRMFADLGVAVIDADEVGRRLMQPGEAVYDAIVAHFGRDVVRDDGSLDRRALAEQAFSHGRLEELNRLVHPPVIAAQEEWMRGVFAADPDAIAMIESALIFEASGKDSRAGSVPGWRERFDRIILVTAPDAVKIRRFIERGLRQAGGGDADSLAADARKRLAAQIPDSEKTGLCDWGIDNAGDIGATQAAVEGIYSELKIAAAKSHCR
jgi:dephospho-CoA kinase